MINLFHSCSGFYMVHVLVFHSKSNCVSAYGRIMLSKCVDQAEILCLRSNINVLEFSGFQEDSFKSEQRLLWHTILTGARRLLESENDVSCVELSSVSDTDGVFDEILLQNRKRRALFVSLQKVVNISQVDDCRGASDFVGE